MYSLFSNCRFSYGLGTPQGSSLSSAALVLIRTYKLVMIDALARMCTHIECTVSVTRLTHFHS
jgi:hypothetical protein